METRLEVVPIRLANGTTVQVQARVRGDERLAVHLLSFDDVMKAIEELSRAMAITVSKARPSRANLEFGIDVAIEKGKGTALLVNGSTTPSIRIALEWVADHRMAASRE